MRVASHFLASSKPGGFSAISRWLSEATPPANRLDAFGITEGTPSPVRQTAPAWGQKRGQDSFRGLGTHWAGLTAEPRDWVFIELARNWYVREPNWKLNQAGELFDMTDAPFAEKLVAADTKDATAIAARQRLQAVLDELNPAGGILDDGDGTGRHANKDKKKAKSK
ncbi:hypothetical protein LBMAG52_08870 [Planctomycetia bacterium]|nr:hypothetical protein LBMAG52_08870 [Planctomycetia bacterium]